MKMGVQRGRELLALKFSNNFSIHFYFVCFVLHKRKFNFAMEKKNEEEMFQLEYSEHNTYRKSSGIFAVYSASL